MSSAADQVRAWARGMYGCEAGAELLIRCGRVYDGAPWVDAEPDGQVAAIDTETLWSEVGVWSGGEQRLVQLAIALLDDKPVHIADILAGLDRDRLVLAMAALSHAGAHEHGAVPAIDNVTGQLTGEWTPAPGPVVPWPNAFGVV